MAGRGRHSEGNAGERPLTHTAGSTGLTPLRPWDLIWWSIGWPWMPRMYRCNACLWDFCLRFHQHHKKHPLFCPHCGHGFVKVEKGGR